MNKKKNRNVKGVNIALLDTKAYICASSLTDFGLFISTEPFLILDWGVLTTGEKYTIIQEVLDSGKILIPFPQKPEEYSNTVLKHFNMNSWEQFYSTGRHCTIVFDYDEGEIAVKPSKYSPSHKSLEAIKRGVIRLPLNANSVDLITAIEKAFESISL